MVMTLEYIYQNILVLIIFVILVVTRIHLSESLGIKHTLIYIYKNIYIYKTYFILIH